MSALHRTLRKVIRPAVMRALLAWERIESGVNYDPTSPKIKANPYEKYRKLRALDPVHRIRLINGWVLTEYEDVDEVLRDHRRFSRDYGSESEYKSLLDLDPPDHTRVRSLVSKAFTPRSVAELHPRIQQIVDDLLDGVADNDRFDLVESFAYPLPVIVIAEMLGVPAEDRDRFKLWSNDIALTVEPTVNDEQAERIKLSGEELIDYFDSIIELRRNDPQDDLITALIAAEEEGDRLTHEELIAMLLLLLVAGNETTRNLIGNGMLALLMSPDQLQRLRDDPDLMDTAVNELLRYDSPVQLDGRMATEDIEIRGKKIRPGQRVICLLGAANRDPSVFTDPDTLDIARQGKSHMSFGRGIHHCLGAPLALLEGRVAFASLLERFSTIRLLREPEYRDQVVLRGVKELWIEVERSPVKTARVEPAIAVSA
jgi:cytochrome P450